MLRAAKIDKNQPEIVQALRAHGAVVRSTAQLKRVFDLLVFYKGHTFIVEVKDGNKPLTDGELECKAQIESTGVKYNVVRCVDDALRLIGVIN